MDIKRQAGQSVFSIVAARVLLLYLYLKKKKNNSYSNAVIWYYQSLFTDEETEAQIISLMLALMPMLDMQIVYVF